jgi:hypothetical protein
MLSPERYAREQALLRKWQDERAAQIDWADEQTRKGLYPHNVDRPCPEMTTPPPYSPEFYRLAETS